MCSTVMVEFEVGDCVFVVPLTFAWPLGDPLGRGQHGAVLQVDEQWVIKLIPLDTRLRDDWSTTAKEFQREAEVSLRMGALGLGPALKTYGSVNVQQRGAGPHSVKAGYLVLEKLDLTLNDWLSATRWTDVQLVWPGAKLQLQQLVHRLVDAGWEHCDCTTDNVMRRSDGSFVWIDFGDTLPLAGSPSLAQDRMLRRLQSDLQSLFPQLVW